MLSACGGPQNRRSDPNQQGVTRADTLQLKDLNYAVEDICTKLSRKYAKGWPAHVALSPDDGRALVRLGEITKKIPRGVNRGVNTSQLRSNLMNALVEQDVLSVVYDKDAAQDLTESQAQDEFDRGQANTTAMDQATFVLRGSIEVEKLESMLKMVSRMQHTAHTPAEP